MIRERQLTINTLAASAQVVTTGLAFLVLYRYVLDHIGAEAFGVWSLVLITASISNLANLGLGSSVVKFVSQYLARGDAVRAAHVVQTALLTLAAFLLIVLGSLYPVATWALSIHPQLKAAPAMLATALGVLPYAFGSFWALSVASVSLGALDGAQRIDLRSALQVGGTLAYLATALVLVPRHGLLGLAWAHLAQSLLLLLASWPAARRLLHALPRVPHRWQWPVLREILGYSVNFQVMAIFWLLFEPLTRWFVSSFGGLSAAAWFEFANRMVFQLRALITAAHQSIVPRIAELKELQPAVLDQVYVRSFRVILFLVLLLLPVLIAAVPLVSWLWIDAFEPVFVTFAVILGIGWFLNLLSNPAYFAYMGIGTLRWNVVGRITIGVLNGAFGWALGMFFGGTGVIVGFTLALVLGSFVTTAAYQREYNISVDFVRNPHSKRLCAVGLVGLAALWVVSTLVGPSFWIAIAAPLVLGLALTVPAWQHPARREITARLAALLGRS